MSESTIIVRCKSHVHVPQTGTSYEPGAVAEVPDAWARNEMPLKTIEAASSADLAAYQKEQAEAEAAEKKAAAAEAAKADKKAKDKE